ncbi:BlaI/MecI/CopY family transcriptional regulator [Clostridium sp. Marseille-P2415]|uniref:BlaI/MecI/CopY family transcriptional regulator n=1 Tax=Clostridium sp. Marseille-P2415 TaxID=1805471 RepID=UPI000988834B|nr:BlaI/MecI/CopY family transcriptional regulator [Clostridium sp. Marseille-P2415]
MKSKLPKISEKEKDIMSVLWCSKDPLTASEITQKGNGLNINTVQASMRNLLKKQYIKIADIVYSGTVLTRCYEPIISAEEYAADQLHSMRLNTLNFSTVNFIDHFLKDSEPDILDKLEDIIRLNKEKRGD